MYKPKNAGCKEYAATSCLDSLNFAIQFLQAMRRMHGHKARLPLTLFQREKSVPRLRGIRVVRQVTLRNSRRCDARRLKYTSFDEMHSRF